MEESATPSRSVRFGIVILLLVAAVIAAGAYALHQRSVVRRLAAQNDQVTAVLQQTRGEIQALKTQVAAATAPAPQKVETAPPATRPSTTRRPIVHRRPEDPRWKKMQAQLDDQGKQIETTRQDLAGARTELEGSIAKTHDELVVLQKKGERNYFEFDLSKAKQFARQGSVGIRLRKANTKNQYADLELMVDDVKLTQKHVNLLQPVVFYAAEGGRPVELVVNSITKNRIHGYVSEPKYSATELATTPADPNAPTVQNGGLSPMLVTPKPRQKLDVPK